MGIFVENMSIMTWSNLRWCYLVLIWVYRDEKVGSVDWRWCYFVLIWANLAISQVFVLLWVLKNIILGGFCFDYIFVSNAYVFFLLAPLLCDHHSKSFWSVVWFKIRMSQLWSMYVVNLTNIILIMNLLMVIVTVKPLHNGVVCSFIWLL